MPRLLTFWGPDEDQFAINPEEVQWVAKEVVGDDTVICMIDGTKFVVTDIPVADVINEINNA